MGKYPGLRLKIEHGNAADFGKYYTGSNKYKKNQRKRKMIEKK